MGIIKLLHNQPSVALLTRLRGSLETYTVHSCFLEDYGPSFNIYWWFNGLFSPGKAPNQSGCPHLVLWKLVETSLPPPLIPESIALSFSQYAAPTFSVVLLGVLTLTFEKSCYPCRDLERQTPSQPTLRHSPSLLFCPGEDRIPGDPSSQ